MVDLTAFKQGDRLKVVFSKPYTEGNLIQTESVVGELQYFGQMACLTNIRVPGYLMPEAIIFCKAPVESVCLEQSLEEVQAQRQARREGEKVFSWAPETTDEVIEQIDTLALMIAREKDDSFFSRKRQLRYQFDAVCDVVDLAKTKRHYVLMKAVIGNDFHPYETDDDRVFRNNTVRPIPSDFKMERAERVDRKARLEESIRIFGEAERETRLMMSALKADGYDVRRPHPNAQELYVRLGEERNTHDFSVSPGQNGMWAMRAVQPDNKTKAKNLARIQRGPAPANLEMAIERHIEEGVFARPSLSGKYQTPSL